jgi:hypothetical protein
MWLLAAYNEHRPGLSRAMVCCFSYSYLATASAVVDQSDILPLASRARTR